MAKKVQLQTNGKEWQMVDGEQVLVDVEKQDIDPITSSSCVQIEGFRTLEEAVSDNKMLSQDLTYTKVMDKVGGDYHQNVLDGQYSKAILYGNTQVNLCEEDSSVALQIPTTFTSFNNGELQIDNKENEVVAPLIKGVTMVNLAQTNSASLDSSESVVIENVKGNTLYTLSFKFTTKNTNSGVTIESYNGDTYLEDTIHKTGLGDVAKFTFATHANATVVKVVNNAAYGGQTIQLDDIMLIEGDQTALDIPFFKGMKSVELVRPLTNLFTDDLVPEIMSATVTNSGGTVTVTSTTISRWALARYHLDLKPNTKYVIMWDGLTFTQTASGIDYIISVCENDTIFSHMGNKFTTLRSIIFNTGDKNLSDINLRIHATTSNSETGKTTVTGLRVFEYDDYLRSVDLQSIGWFSGTKNVAVEPVKTCSKNLYPYGDINFTSSSAAMWCDAKGNQYMYGDIAQKSKSRFLLKKGIYKFSYNSASNVEAVAITDDKGSSMYYSDTTFTLIQDGYFSLVVKTVDANTSTTVSNIQIERGETATDYVAHDSRYYEPNGQDTIVLRSLPNGVCDTFNLQTGEYVQNIREVVLNGNNNQAWKIDGTNSETNISGFYMANSNVVGFNISSTQYVICDKYNTISGLLHWKQRDKEGCIDNTGNIAFTISNSKLSEVSGNGFKQYLQQNPITVQYQLATPITTIIPRTVKRNYNGTVSTVDVGTYTNKVNFRLPKNPSYLTINSMTSIKPVVEPITYIDFKTRLKTNTDYSVIIDKDSTDKTINLGGTSKTYVGKMLVRTPSINLEQNLRISGSGSIQNIMVIEGDVLDKELPYFNGMCNVKMPIVRNCGKNLFDGELYINYGIQINGTTSGEPAIPGLGTITDWVTTKNHIPVKKGDIISIAIDANDSDITSNRRYTYVYKYDTQKHFMVNNRYDLGANTKTFTISHDGYIRCTIKTHNVHNISITKENTPSVEQYRGNDICIAQGEIDLPKDMFEQGGFSTNNGSTYETMKYNSATRLRSKSLIKVKPNTTYYIKNNLPPTYFNVYQWNANMEFMQGTSKTDNTNELLFTTTNDTHYIHFLFSKAGDKTITVSEFDWSFFQLLELDSTVQLRSLPNGVKDELNLLTGEYIQRVGEVVFDGSEDENWQLNNTESTTTKRFIIGNLIGSNVTNDWNGANKYVCDKLNKYLWSDTVEFGITVIDNSAFLYNNNIDYSIGALKTWLSQNPITVQYELAEPIISYPRIVSNTQEREVGVKLPNGVCDTYNPSTGITVKRVGKVVLDGSEKYNRDTSSTKPTDLERFNTSIKDMVASPYNTGNFVVETSGYNIVNNDTTSPRKLPNVWNYYKASIYLDFATTAFGMATSDSTDTKISKLKTYLSSNPITVYYELANPIVTTDIVLPNGVHDEYNPLTGLYTKRVGYIEFDGSEDWKMNNTQPTSTIRFNITHEESKNKSVLLTNGYKYLLFDEWNTVPDIESCSKSSSAIGFAISRSKLASEDIDGFKTYLSQNPIKVWYELATPQRIQLIPYFGLPMPYAYKDGYLIMDSAYEGQTLPPEITYQLTVNRTGQITQNNIKLKEHTARLSNLEYILIEATLESIFSREMQNFELELMNVELPSLDE